MDSSNQHRHIMTIPHRRPAYGVNAPALFRHVGFRLQDPYENPLTATHGKEADERRGRFIEKLNLALAMIQNRCRVKNIFSFTDAPIDRIDREIPVKNTMLTVLDALPDELAGWRGRLRVDIHSEYYFVTLILDQLTGHDCVPSIGQVEHALSTRGCAEVDTKSFITEFYERVWETMGRHLSGGFDQLPGQRFTEFRAIALRDTESPFIKDRRENEDRFTIPEIESAVFDEARRSLRAWLARNRPCIHQILNVDEFTKTVDQDANCVLCEVLDGAGVYGSSVRQTPAAASLLDPTPRRAGEQPADDFQPLRYFLLYNGLSKYQLGRLVRRTHVMGELRVAAVLDAPLLADASSRIRSLGNKIDSLLNDREGAATLADHELDAVLQELNRINSLVPGGLMYRINRSRYYAATFRERMPDMRVQRLEGWQPYNEFFRRNLYQVFDEIDQIGKRNEVLSERVNRLTIARNAERLRRSQEDIQKLVSEMNSADKTILEIQELGEWIGLTALTYYLGKIIGAFLSSSIAHWCSSGVKDGCLPRVLAPIQDLVKHHEMIEFTGYALAAVIALLVRLNWRRKWGRHRENPIHAPAFGTDDAPTESERKMTARGKITI